MRGLAPQRVCWFGGVTGLVGSKLVVPGTLTLFGLPGRLLSIVLFGVVVEPADGLGLAPLLVVEEPVTPLPVVLGLVALGLVVLGLVIVPDEPDGAAPVPLLLPEDEDCAAANAVLLISMAAMESALRVVMTGSRREDCLLR